jgi:hypothetical protein
MVSRAAALLVAATLAGCASAPPPAESATAQGGTTVTPEMLKPLTDAYREFVASLLQLDSVMPQDRADALRKLQASGYGYFPDDKSLIQKAAAGDDAARRELARRGNLLDAMFVFWGKVDLPKWNDARKRIVALGQDARVILVNTLLRMLLNGHMREQWPQIRFQLIAVGDDAYVTAEALFKAKVERTPHDTPIFHKDDLVQVLLVILGFGEKGRPVIEEGSRSPKVNVRRSVAVALGEGRATEFVGLLGDLLKKDTDWKVRSDAAVALASIRDRAAAGTILLQAFKAERDRNVRRLIAESLGALVYADAVPTLVQALDVPDYEFVERVMFALFRITGERFMNSDEWRTWYAKEYARWKAKRQ